MENPVASSPRAPLPVTASQYLSDNVYPTLEPALEALLQAAFPPDTIVGDKCPPDFKPLKWLAKHLKEKNKNNTAKRQAQTWETALQLAGKEGNGFQEIYNNAVSATRSVFWPCSAIVAIKDVIIEEVPANPPANASDGAGEEEAEAPPAGEGEDQDQPSQPQMQRIEIPILRYVATSHPEGWSIEGCSLRYLEHGVTGRVLESGEPLLIPNVADEPNVHFFCGSVPGIRGSYCAVPLMESTGEVYGVLAMDTLLDGRVLEPAQMHLVQEIAARVDAAREPHAIKERERKEEIRKREEEERLAAEEARRREEEERIKAEEEGGEETEDKGS